jgi:hypothetical protein
MNLGWDISFKECITQGPYGHKNVRGSVQTGTYRHGIVLGEPVGKFTRDASPACIRSLLNIKGPKNTIAKSLVIPKRGQVDNYQERFCRNLPYCIHIVTLFVNKEH